MVSPTTARGEPPAIVYLAEGEAAPFAGDLFPPARSIRLGLRLEAAEKALAAEVRHLNRVFGIRSEAAAERSVVRIESANRRLQLTTIALEEATAWYRSPSFVALVSVATCLLLATTVGYTWSELAAGVR